MMKIVYINSKSFIYNIIYFLDTKLTYPYLIDREVVSDKTSLDSAN